MSNDVDLQQHSGQTGGCSTDDMEDHPPSLDAHQEFGKAVRFILVFDVVE
jgi:hypothetical protein